MRILVVGDGHSVIHEVAVAAAFKELGHEVETFYWQSYFESKYFFLRLLSRVQNKFLLGPIVNRLNRHLIKKAIDFNPELIFIYRGSHIEKYTLEKLKFTLPGCKLIGYNNDDPFAKGHPYWLWRHFLKCVPFYDFVFAYREHNISEYINLGAKKVYLLMPWFLPDKDNPIKQGESIEKIYDVAFIGHFENDERIDYLKKVAEANITFGLFGPAWDRAPNYHWLQKYQPVLPVRGSHYRKTMLSTKIALCFLSSLNRDAYTRRCFEIPAMGVFMLCQYSDDLAKLFDDGIDVVFFRNQDEMMEKISYYTCHDELREQIARNGRSRVLRDKHDVVSRMDYVLNQITTVERLENVRNFEKN